MSKPMLSRAIVSLALLLVCSASNAFWFQPSLSRIHQQIVSSFPDVDHISSEQLTLLLDKAVVFDVREADEFAVSHIASAIHLPPQTNAEQFLARYGEAIRGKPVIFYCSVGRRSSAMAEQLQTVLRQAGASRSANLEGGLFHWVNQALPVKGNGIHPYNRYWARLIDDKSKIVYSADD